MTMIAWVLTGAAAAVVGVIVVAVAQGGGTSVANALSASRADVQIVDPEVVGAALRVVLGEKHRDEDFQDWPA
jgi:hypothetical protein